MRQVALWCARSILGPLLGVLGVAVGTWFMGLLVAGILDVQGITDGAVQQVIELPVRLPEAIDLAIQLMHRELGQ